MKNNLYIENLFSFLEKQECAYNKLKKSKNTNKIFISDIETIEFKSLSFRYKKNLPYALKNVSFCINKGDRVAIVGKNGSGKSTIIKLLCGFYDCYEGDILINGYSLRDIDIENYMKHLGTVFQDFTKYLFTLGENLELANITSKADINIGLKLNEMTRNGLLKYVNKLPLGIDTQLGYIFENGVQLSGGEWQQLAIARSLMKITDLYILDEPCSSLDLESEYKIYKYLKQLSDEKICILVSHRLHNIVNFADYVMVFQGGELIENDSVDNLLSRDSIFRENFFKLETSKDYTANKGVKYGC